MDNRIQAITTDTLTPLVQQLLNNTTITINRWQYEPVYGGFGGAIGGTALYRFKGNTTDHHTWSLILKVLMERPNETVSSPYYWKREYEVYRSGMLDTLPDIGLTPPKTVGFEDFGDICWVWMEDIIDTKQNWTMRDYQNAARHIGRFNGAYMTGQHLPDYEWLSHDWHCAITPALTDTFEQLDMLLEHPLAQHALPIEEKESILSIWQNIDIYRDALADLPKTLCHIDAFRRNLLHRDNDIVLIDWALVGHASIGEDLVPMVSLSLYLDGNSLDYANQVDKAVFEGYVTGLREMGWTGDAQLARIGYTCAMTLRGLAGVKQDLNLVINEGNHAQLRQTHKTDNLEAIADFFADVRRFRLLQMAQEARQLLGR